MESWYLRNRERCLELGKVYRETNKEKVREYQQKYYQLRKASRPPPPPKVPKPPAPPPQSLVLFKNPPVPRSRFTKKGSRPPKATYDYTPKEDHTNGWLLKPHQIDKLLRTCPQGFLVEEPKENPFIMTFF